MTVDWYGIARSESLGVSVRVGSGGRIERNVGAVSGITWDPSEQDTRYGNAIGGGLSPSTPQQYRPARSFTNKDVYDVCWTGVAFVAVGADGQILYSREGATWTHIDSPTEEHLYGVGSRNPVVMAVGANGTVIYSRNAGITWQVMDIGLTVDLYSVKMEGSYLITGDDDTIVMGEVESFSPDVYVTEILAFIDNPRSNARQGLLAADGLRMDEGLFPGYYCYANDNFVTQSTSEGGQRNAITELEAFSFHVRTFIANETLAESLMLSGSVLGYYHRVANDTLGVNDAPIGTPVFMPTVVDTMAVNEVVVPSGVMVVAVSEMLDLDALSFGGMIQQALISEDLLFGLQLAYRGEVYDLWVMNTENQGVTRYEGWNFTGFASADFGTYGTDGEKIYLLEGETDDNEEIDVLARTGKHDFGTAYVKFVDRAYLGLRNSGDLVLKTITGDNIVRYYKVQNTSADGLHGGRAKLGKGVKSRYWQFELVNVDGGDLELESMEFLPLRTTRRVR